jgi:hypothetical protein
MRDYSDIKLIATPHKGAQTETDRKNRRIGLILAVLGLVLFVGGLTYLLTDPLWGGIGVGPMGIGAILLTFGSIGVAVSGKK